jgi:hypothetical protein
VRHQNLKVLAAAADARWASKPGFLDAPGQARGQPLPTLETGSLGLNEETPMAVKEGAVKDTGRGNLGTVAKAEPPRKPEEP